MQNKKLLQRFFSGGAILIVLLLSAVFITPEIKAPEAPGGIEAVEKDFFDELNECTTGLASGLATPDGRPLLWKNRDVGNSNQEYHYVDDGRIPFVGLTYMNENTWQYYAGINAHGFALENSNSYNLPAGPAFNGYGGGDDDGEIHMQALATCRTVDDFADFLDSLNIDGRTLNSNYGAFDAFGGAAMFETGGYEYTRVEAIDEPYGIVVRSNYSFSGHGLNNRPSYWGPNRYDRAYALWKEAVEENRLTARFVFQQVSRNLGAEGMDDYDMPYHGYYRDYPYGCIPNGECICRSTTRSIFIGQGVRPGENPARSIIWAMAGNQIGSIATPLFVRAGSVPVEYDSPNGSILCNLAKDIADYAYENGNFGSAVNTFKLRNEAGTGYWDWAFPIEDLVFARTERFLNSPNFSYDQMENFQNTLARQVADSISNWNPTYDYTEIFEPVFFENNIVLHWEEVQDDDARGFEPRGYNVYRSSQPFREGDEGEMIAYVENNRYTDANPLPYGGFYRVIAVY